MKATVKKQFQEFIDNVSFPTVVYVYENSRIIAANDQARDIIGQHCKNMNCLWEGQVRQKYSKQVLNNGSDIFFNTIIYSDNEPREVDMEINSFILDNIHIVICFFEYSYKQCFVKHLRGQTPRIFWKDKKTKYQGANEAFRKDIKYWEDFSTDLSEVFDDETKIQLTDDEHYVISLKENQYNIIQTIKTEQGSGFFTKINRMPLLNKNGTVVGILGIYMLILNREEYKRLFDNTLRENNILSEMISKSDMVVISWIKDTNWTIEYISPNVIRFGYSAEDFYSGKVSWNKIIYSEEKGNIPCADSSMLDYIESTIVREYQIIKADKEIAWIKCEITPVLKNNKVTFIEGIIQDITDKKRLEKELNHSKRALQLNYDSLFRVLDNICSYIFVINKIDNRILYVNNKVLEIYHEEPIGQNCFEFLAAKGIEIRYSTDNKDLVIHSDTNHFSYSEYYDKTNDRYLSIHTEDFQLSDQITATMINLHDITETIEHQRNID